MFEDKTYEALLQEVLDNAPNGIDTRQGSIFYDAVSGVIIKIAELYIDLDLVFTLTQVTSTLRKETPQAEPNPIKHYIT